MHELTRNVTRLVSVRCLVSYPVFLFFSRCAADHCRPIQSRLCHLSSPWLCFSARRRRVLWRCVIEPSQYRGTPTLQRCDNRPRPLGQGGAPADMYATRRCVFSPAASLRSLTSNYLCSLIFRGNLTKDGWKNIYFSTMCLWIRPLNHEVVYQHPRRKCLRSLCILSKWKIWMC